MTGILLEAAASAGTNWWSYVLIGVVVLLLIAMPIMMNARNKRESQKVQEQTNSLKVGDKVLTTSGVYGTITELKFDDAKKLVVLETGGKTKSYLTVDAYAIYTVFKSDEEIAADERAKAEAAKLKIEQENAKKAEKEAKKHGKTDLEAQAAAVSAQESQTKTNIQTNVSNQNNQNKQN